MRGVCTRKKSAGPIGSASRRSTECGKNLNMNKAMEKTLVLGCAIFGLISSIALADSVLWTGEAGDGNWHTGSNWTNTTAGTSGSPPSTGDTAYFFDSSSSSLTVSSGQTIGALYFSATNTDYSVQINSPAYLEVLGTLRLGTLQDPGTAIQRTVTVSGNAISVSNTAANLVLNQGQYSANGSHVTLNMAGLDLFNADINGLGIGSVNYENAVAQRNAGTLYLAKTNLIVLRSSLSRDVCLTNPLVTNAIEVVYVGAGNHANVRSYLYLGISNAIYVDNLCIGKSKASAPAAATMKFNPNFVGYQPVAYFRGVGGDSTRVTWWAVGDMAGYGSSAQYAVGTNDFTGGYVDALVDIMSLGRDTSGSQTGTGSGRVNTGTLIFDKGVIDVNLLIVGNQSLGTTGNSTPNAGYVFIAGPDALLRVNDELRMAATAIDSTSARNTYGLISVNAGTLCANTITVGQYSASNAVIQIQNGGALYLSNTIASASKPLRTLNLSDATLGVRLAGTAPIVWVTNLVTGGSQNQISVIGSITFSSYPVQIPIIKYVSLTGAGNNFVLGTTPPNVVNAYLTNNEATASLDLVIPTDPRPVITTQPDGFAGPIGSTVTLAVVATGVEPLYYQWEKDGAPLSDGGNISGSKTATMVIQNAQVTDSGTYQVVITNAYGSVTSAPVAVTISSGNVAPTISGLVDQSVLQGQDATFAPSVAGIPTPWVQWYKNGVPIPGANSTSLTIYNCQYPADEALYSIVATNVAGTASNAAMLTVVVPPTIVTQPQSTTAPVGAPASFTVVVNAHPAPVYQWYKGSDIVSDATNATLVFAAVQPADAGTYKVRIANLGGTVWSDPVTLTVTSTSVNWTNLAPNATSGVCLDTLLHVKFNSSSVALGNGTLRIYDAVGTLVDTIDLSLNDVNNAQIRTIGGGNYYAYPVIIRSNVATIYPHPGVLTSNTTYYVLMDTGFFKDGAGACIVGITDTNTWRFTTKVALPDPYATTNVVVAADGTGDFATVQGVIDWIPAYAGLPYTVNIKKGVYEEINRIPTGKNNITFVGEGWRETIITYANNNSFQLGNAGTATRCMFYAGGDDLVFKNITFTNSTPQGGSQAEAIRVQGMRIMFDNCTLCSYQDTILINTAGSSSGLFNKCLVQGDVDFIWGSGIGFFTNCEIRAMRRANNSTGVYTQARTPSATYGFVFVDCLVSCSAPGMTNWSLGRDAGNSYPYGNVAWINCRMDSHISPAGWTDGGLTDKSTLRFWEYKSTDLTGTNLIPTDQRVPWSRQLEDWEAAMLRDVATVMSPVTWTPALAAYVAASPTNQTVYTGQTLTIAAAVGGLPEPVCQWFKDGSPIPGATNAVLVIPNVQTNAAGSYYVCVTNGYGYDVSSTATVVVLPAVPPALTKPVMLPNGSVRFTLTGTPGVQYRLWASTNIALAPVTNTWTLLRTGTFTSDPIEVEDTDAPNYRQRFYILTTP